MCLQWLYRFATTKYRPCWKNKSVWKKREIQIWKRASATIRDKRDWVNGRGGSVVGWLPSTLEAMHPPPALHKQMRKNLFKRKKTHTPPWKQKQNQQQQQKTELKQYTSSVSAHQHHPGKLPEFTFMCWFHRLGWSPWICKLLLVQRLLTHGSHP